MGLLQDCGKPPKDMQTYDVSHNVTDVLFSPCYSCKLHTVHFFFISRNNVAQRMAADQVKPFVDMSGLQT